MDIQLILEFKNQFWKYHPVREREKKREKEREGQTEILHCINGGHLLFYNCNIFRIIDLKKHHFVQQYLQTRPTLRFWV